jgi:hypothetical protein
MIRRPLGVTIAGVFTEYDFQTDPLPTRPLNNCTGWPDWRCYALGGGVIGDLAGF